MGSGNKSRSRAPPLKSNLGSRFDSLRPACANLNPNRHASGQAGEPKAEQTFKYSPGGPDLDLENRFLNPETDLLNLRKNCFMCCFKDKPKFSKPKNAIY